MVEDRIPQRAAGMAAEYVAELDRVVTSLNNSAAHKGRVFLEQRLAQANQDLEAAEQDFSKFATKNTAIDIKEQGRAMLGTAAAVEAQSISAQTELQGLRQLYTESNGRVRTAEARVDELKHQLQMLGGNGIRRRILTFCRPRRGLSDHPPAPRPGSSLRGPLSPRHSARGGVCDSHQAV